MKSQSIIAGLVSVFVVAPVSWMAFDRNPPYIRTSGIIEPMDPLPGERITVRWTIKELRYCPTDHNRQVTRTIIDSKGIEHRYAPTLAQYNHILEPTEIIRDISLPPNITPGLAKYHSVVCYACNPFQEIIPVCVSSPDIQFNIAKPVEEK